MEYFFDFQGFEKILRFHIKTNLIKVIVKGLNPIRIITHDALIKSYNLTKKNQSQAQFTLKNEKRKYSKKNLRFFLKIDT